MSSTAPDDRRLTDSLAFKALITALISVIVIPAGPLALVLGVLSFVRERFPGMAASAVVLGSLESLVLVSIFLVPNGCGPVYQVNEAAARTTLTSGIHPAMIQFQTGTFRDEDGDGVGEYGFFDEMSGGQEQRTDNRPIFLPANMAGARPVMHGFRFVVYLPDGAGVAATRAAITDHSPTAIDRREHQWIAYAWPEQWGTSGKRMFCIDARGQVWCTEPAAAGVEPRWDSALSDGWGSEPAAGWSRWRK